MGVHDGDESSGLERDGGVLSDGSAIGFLAGLRLGGISRRNHSRGGGDSRGDSPRVLAFRDHEPGDLGYGHSAQAASDPNLVNGNMPSGDNWNYYANQIMGKSFTPAWPTGSISFAAYWAGEAPVIGAQTGLGSIMAGLGALVNRQRRSMGMGDYESSAFTPPRLTNNPAIPNDWN